MFLVLLVVLALLYPLANYWLSNRAVERRNEQEAASRGCSPAPIVPRGFFGLGWLIQSIRATKNDRGPQYVVEVLDRVMGKDVHTCVVPILDYKLILTRDPPNVQAMLSSKPEDWDISEHRTASWVPMFGHGVFTSRGEQWKKSRALVRPQFNTEQINDLNLIERHVQHLFAAIDRRYKDHADGPDKAWTCEFDLQPLFYNLTLDVTTELIYGYSVHSQNPLERLELPHIPGFDTPDRENIGMHMDAGKAWIDLRGAFWKYRWLLPTRQFYAHCAAINKYADWFVRLCLLRGDKYLDGLEPGTEHAGPRNRFVLLYELAKETQDPVELRSQTLNILTAGRDTTAALLGWVFYLLARNPGVCVKLRNEILDQFGPYVPSEPSRIGFRELRDSMPYLRAVINEALRVAPVIPLNERVALRDTVLPRGGGPDGDKPIFVPEGRQVLILAYGMTRREDIWGPDANEFRPERWLENGGRKPGFEFIPFGGGVRQCLGRKQNLPMSRATEVTTGFLLTRLQNRLPASRRLMSLPDCCSDMTGSRMPRRRLMLP